IALQVYTLASTNEQGHRSCVIVSQRYSSTLTARPNGGIQPFTPHASPSFTDSNTRALCLLFSLPLPTTANLGTRPGNLAKAATTVPHSPHPARRARSLPPSPSH